MYKQRDKYFTTNRSNIVNRIKEQLASGFTFTPYEFMSLRYACCEQIADIDMGRSRAQANLSPVFIHNWNRMLKKHKKELQECIQLLDNWYYEHMFKEEQ